MKMCNCQNQKIYMIMIISFLFSMPGVSECIKIQATANAAMEATNPVILFVIPNEIKVSFRVGQEMNEPTTESQIGESVGLILEGEWLRGGDHPAIAEDTTFVVTDESGNVIWSKSVGLVGEGWSSGIGGGWGTGVSWGQVDSNGDPVAAGAYKAGVIFTQSTFDFPENFSGVISLTIMDITVSSPNGWSQDIRLTNSSQPYMGASFPSVVLDSSNNAHIIWSDRRDYNSTTRYFSELYYMKVDNSGVKLVEDTRLTNAPGSSYSKSPDSIAVDSQDNIHIVWKDYMHGSGIYYTKLDSNGNMLVDDKLIASGVSPHLHYPSVVVDLSDSLYVCTDEQAQGTTYLKLNNNGGVLIEKTSIGERPHYWCGKPSIAVNSQNNIYLTWFDSFDDEIHFIKLDNDGNILINNTRVSGILNRDEITPKITTDSANNMHLIWQDEDANDIWQLYYMKLDNTGRILVEETVITSRTTGEGWIEDLSTAIDSNNTLHIAWSDDRDGNFEIYYTRLDNNGNPLISDTRLTSCGGTSMSPSIAVDSNNKVHVTWYDNRNGYSDIYYKNNVSVLPDVVLNSPSNASYVAPDNIVLQWGSIVDTDGDSIEYCVTVKKDDSPDDIPIFMGCDDEIFISETSYTLPFSLEPAKTYWWAVWARDENDNWSASSDWRSFRTIGKQPLTLEELNNYFFFDVDFIDRESIYSVVRNCIGSRYYTYRYLKGDGTWATVIDLKTNKWIRDNHSNIDEPVGIIDYGNGNIQTLITPYLDAVWGNNISDNDSFNTVYSGTPTRDEKFEVISHIDRVGPFDGTEKASFNGYFFTYNTKDDRSAVTQNEWIDYLKAITQEYGRPIDTLTIFAHGSSGSVTISEAFHLNINTAIQMSRLDIEDILSDNATILIFSCNVGQGEKGRSFVQALADATSATLYANDVGTGPLIRDALGRVTQDWDLNVVAVPENYVVHDILEAPLRSDNKIHTMFPGGIMVEIAEESLNADGKLIVTNTIDHLGDSEINTEGMNFLAAYDFVLEGTELFDQKFLKVILPYDDSSFIDGFEISVKYWDTNLQQWSDIGISDVQVNEEGHYVTFKTTHTSVFAVLQEASIPGDLDGDGDVDRDDLNIILSHRNQPASAYPECDLDGDGMITALDARKLVLLCTRPRCACE